MALCLGGESGWDEDGLHGVVFAVECGPGVSENGFAPCLSEGGLAGPALRHKVRLVVRPIPRV